MSRKKMTTGLEVTTNGSLQEEYVRTINHSGMTICLFDCQGASFLTTGSANAFSFEK